jgi:hypothetical protein
MIVIEKNEGKKIAYELNGTRLSFADGELTLNLARYQQDDPVTRDIMVDSEGYLTNGRGRYYVAQVEIPAKEYEEIPVEPDGESGDEMDGGTERRALPLNTDDVTLYLFSIEGILIR